ncbi:hypothetical protein Bca4012_058598 [Brassica carinata]
MSLKPNPLTRTASPKPPVRQERMSVHVSRSYASLRHASTSHHNLTQTPRHRRRRRNTTGFTGKHRNQSPPHPSFRLAFFLRRASSGLSRDLILSHRKTPPTTLKPTLLYLLRRLRSFAGELRTAIDGISSAAPSHLARTERGTPPTTTQLQTNRRFRHRRASIDLIEIPTAEIKPTTQEHGKRNPPLKHHRLRGDRKQIFHLEPTNRAKEASTSGDISGAGETNLAFTTQNRNQKENIHLSLLKTMHRKRATIITLNKHKSGPAVAVTLDLHHMEERGDDMVNLTGTYK